MPVHRVLLTSLESSLADIEKTERVVSTVESGDGAVLVFTEPRAKRTAPGDRETR